mmetsp:Transcript_73397/g.202595  ORF Transcript_73397/g.202595 Transcript_73397/m.202595 type:complete len:284 (+) Transcript_73397:123-974(+)
MASLLVEAQRVPRNPSLVRRHRREGGKVARGAAVRVEDDVVGGRVLGVVPAGVALPTEVRMRLIVHLQLPHAEGAFAERRPIGANPADLARQPIEVRPLAVAAVAQVQVCGATHVGAVPVHRKRALIGVHVPVDHQVHAIAVEQVLHGLLHELGLANVAGVGVVEGDMHQDNQPRRCLSVEGCQVLGKPRVLRGVLCIARIGVQRDHVHRADVAAPVGGVVGAGGRRGEGHGVALVVRHVRLRGALLMVARAVHRRHASPDRLVEPAIGVPSRAISVGVAQVA